MYSVVLMMAITTGSDSADFGRRGCSSCSGCHGGCHGTVVYSCHGGCSGCHSSCSCSGRRGLFGGLFGGKKRCNGCSGCHGCHGYVCNGGHCHGGHCHGGHCGGFVHCNGGCSGTCGGGVIYPPVGPGGVIVEPKTKEMPKTKEKTSVDAPATIVVTLPEGAKLTIDGNATASTSARRTFTTPALDVNSDYVYTLRAEIVTEGRPVVQTQTVTVRGGQVTNVPFTMSTGAVASR